MLLTGPEHFVAVLLQLCRPLESTEAPEAVREVWVMVDEYMLTEAEVSFIKLLETLDKTAQHISSAVASNQPEHCPHVPDCAVADTGGISILAQEDSSSKQSTDTISFSSSSSSSSSASVLEETRGAQQSDTLVKACSTKLVFHPQTDNVTASSFDEQQDCHHAAALGRSQAQPDCQGPDRHWNLGQDQCQDPFGQPSESRFEPSSNPQAHRPLPLHSSASSHVPVPLQVHTSASSVPKDNMSSNSSLQACCDATHALAANSTGKGATRWDSDQQWRVAACTLLYNPRTILQDRDSPGRDSSLISVSEPRDDQQEAGISNMQILTVKAKELQVGGA